MHYYERFAAHGRARQKVSSERGFNASLSIAVPGGSVAWSDRLPWGHSQQGVNCASGGVAVF